MDWTLLVSLALGLLGGGGLVSLLTAAMSREKTAAETAAIEVSSAEAAVRLMEMTARRLDEEIARLHQRLTGSLLDGEDRDRQLTAVRTAELQCRADLESLTALYAKVTVSLAEQREVNDHFRERLAGVEQQVTRRKADLASMGSILEAVQQVSGEVTTGNSQTLAHLADMAESRRVTTIPAGERTNAEQTHLDAIPEGSAPPEST